MVKILSLLLFCCAIAASIATADESLEAFVDSTSQEILSQVNNGREEFDKDPSVLYGQLGAVMDTLVDFESLTRGVMGKYYKDATDNQKIEFQRALRIYIIEVYTKALVKFKSKAIQIVPLEKAPTSKAIISMNVTTQDDKTFKLTYSMANKDSRWQVRNIIVDGINMGLTYRSQFDSMMISSSNDMDAVISKWDFPEDDEGST